MKLNLIHLSVRNLNAAIVWFENVPKVPPGFRNELMATFSFDAMTLNSSTLPVTMPQRR